MSLIGSIGAVASASGEGAVDWEAVRTASTAAIDAGVLQVQADERRAFAGDLRDARTAIVETTGLSVPLPASVELQHRHHWIDANVETFRRVLAPLDSEPIVLPGLTNRLNTATMTTLFAVLGRSVQGQYDPRLFGDGAPGLYFVVPNLRTAARRLAVDGDRFRRWIVFHEVAHAAEFGAAPWLVGHLEAEITRALEALASGSLDADAVREVDATMTAIEGYAELVMDRAIDGDVDDLREKLDARRRGGNPLTVLVRRLVGLGIKRRQYERGRAFFEAVADARDVRAAGAVWREPTALPTASELSHPTRWLDRVDP